MDGREVEAACRTAASNETRALPETAMKAWAYYEGVPDAKHESTRLRNAFMTGFLAAEAAAEARPKAGVKDADDQDLLTELEARGYVVSAWNHEDGASAIPEEDAEGLELDRREEVGRCFLALASTGLQDVLGQRGNDYLSEAWQEHRDEAMAEAAPKA